ncbi:MAG TPA: mechanosensitive ion channel [Tenuifilaceae bacterium]|nr:mechanosensitive ion channel [Tenuifilaceae bacterium]
MQLEIINKQIAEKYQMLEQFEGWLISQGASETLAQFLKVGISIFTILILALIADFVAKRIFLTSMKRIARRTTTEWDDILIKKKFFHYLAHIIPALVVYATIGIALYDYIPGTTHFVQSLCKIYMVILAIFAVNAFIESVNSIYKEYPFAASRPIKGYLQVIKIIIFIFGSIIIISIIINRNPNSLLIGLGTSTAVLMLIFKDAINGLVASIQLSANKMLNIGDWIELPNRNIDGNVTDISLTTIKVRNFDNTISTVPPFALINESFKNWRGMQESGGRRIMKSLYIDYKTVKFCTPDFLSKVKDFPFIGESVKSYLEKVADCQTDADLLKGDIPTNLTLFRKYIEAYLQSLPEVNTSLDLLIRIKQPVEYGIPLEIYFFINEKRWAFYEKIQSQIMEYLMAIIPMFELKVFQRMTSDDIRTMIKSVDK